MKLIKLGVSGLIVDRFPFATKCLLIRREKNPYQGLWSLPGGQLEFGEYVENAIKREIQEEIGLRISFPNPRVQTVLEVLSNNKHYMIISKLCIETAERQKVHENLTYKYFLLKRGDGPEESLDTLHDNQCTPNLLNIINQLVNMNETLS